MCFILAVLAPWMEEFWLVYSWLNNILSSHEKTKHTRAPSGPADYGAATMIRVLSLSPITSTIDYDLYDYILCHFLPNLEG